jgi:hypothetical protein
MKYTAHTNKPLHETMRYAEGAMLFFGKNILLHVVVKRIESYLAGGRKI